MAAIKTWLEQEPILTRVGPVAIALIGYLAAKGFVDNDTADLILAIVAALVGGVGLVSARGLVTPTYKLDSDEATE